MNKWFIILQNKWNKNFLRSYLSVLSGDGSHPDTGHMSSPRQLLQHPKDTTRRGLILHKVPTTFNHQKTQGLFYYTTQDLPLPSYVLLSSKPLKKKKYRITCCHTFWPAWAHDWNHVCVDSASNSQRLWQPEDHMTDIAAHLSKQNTESLLVFGSFASFVSLWFHCGTSQMLLSGINLLLCAPVGWTVAVTDVNLNTNSTVHYIWRQQMTVVFHTGTFTGV